MVYAIVAIIVLLIFVAWRYRTLLIDSLKLKSVEEEAKNHAEINKKNKIIDKEAQAKYDAIDKIDNDDLLKSLLKSQQKPKDGKDG